MAALTDDARLGRLEGQTSELSKALQDLRAGQPNHVGRAGVGDSPNRAAYHPRGPNFRVTLWLSPLRVVKQHLSPL